MKQKKWSKPVKIFVIVISVFLAPFLLLLVGIAGFIIYWFFFSGGDGKYTGDHPELYSIAINSVPGTRGYWPDSHGRWSSKVVFIEKDSLGRIMFLYYEKGKISEYSLIISQKNDGKYAYYYPDYNFISISLGDCVIYDSTNKLIIGDPAVDKCMLPSPTEDIFNLVLENIGVEKNEELKKRNDWNMAIDIDRCERVKIVRQKAEGPVRNSSVRSFYKKALGSDARSHAHTVFFTKDNYGRSMYVGYGRHGTGRIVVMLFQPDDSYDINIGVMELIDVNNYQDDLKAFKERNNWNINPSGLTPLRWPRFLDSSALSFKMILPITI
jgi:hypothetical protein